MPRVETQCINTSSRPKRSNPPSSYGGGILLCSFCVAYMQKDRKKQQDLQRLKTLKTRIKKGKPAFLRVYDMVDPKGFEPSASAMRTRRSPN